MRWRLSGSEANRKLSHMGRRLKGFCGFFSGGEATFLGNWDQNGHRSSLPEIQII